MSAAAIEARLCAASDRAGSLRPGDGQATKIDLSGDGVTKRLQLASDLLDACRTPKRKGNA
jgi:hypothetical protein